MKAFAYRPPQPGTRVHIVPINEDGEVLLVVGTNVTKSSLKSNEIRMRNPSVSSLRNRNMQYTFYLTQHKRNKKLAVLADNTTNAVQYIKDNYPNWQISMFWPDWPQKKH